MTYLFSRSIYHGHSKWSPYVLYDPKIGFPLLFWTEDIFETANTDSHISQVTARAAYLDPNKDTSTIPASELPKCPECKIGLLRPGVVVSSILISLRQSHH